MPLTDTSPIEQALYKIIGAPSSKSGGTDDSSSFQFAPRSSYTTGIFDNRGGSTDASSGQAPGTVPSAYSAPATAAPTSFAATNTPYDPAAAAVQAAAAQAAASPAAAVAAPAVAAAPPALWKSYDEYWADKGMGEQAKGYGAYQNPNKYDTSGNWGASGDPYRWNMEYGKYLESLPAGQRATAQAGVGSDWVRSGLTNSVYSGGKVIPIEGADYYWQNPTHQAEWTESQKAKSAQAASAPKAPTRPTGRVSWQEDQQYWRDLAAYNQGKTAGGGGGAAAAAPTAAAAAAPARVAAPTRPTGNVSWQVDQQYWRDLDNYNKANRLGAYR